VERPKNKGGRGGADHPILFREGHLEASIQYHAGDTYVEVGTNRKFPGGEDSAAAIHQLADARDAAARRRYRRGRSWA